MPACLNRVLHFFTHFSVTLSTDDYLSEHEIWPEFDPAKSLRVRRIVQSDEHSYLLFVAPTLMFRPHLVTAADSGFTEIWTNDRHMLAAAPHFGLAGRSV